MSLPTRIGRYEVVSALGQGAMGAVYEAVDPLIERRVAVKTINLSLNLSSQERVEFEARFYREAKSAGRLNHPNIVTIYDVGEVDDVAYIAMEYLEGQTLREVLDSGVVLPVGTIAGIGMRIANGLHYAHENQVVHRDVKPANVMITPARDVKIMDFGIAQMPTGSRTQLGTVLGSPKYMAPEQVAGQPTDRRTDIFALGVVLYEMLAGTTPFNGDNLSAIMYRVLNEAPKPPSEVNPRLPVAFDAIVKRALAKRPADRYQSALELAHDLSEHDSGLALEARKVATGVHELVVHAEHARARDDGTVFLPPTRVGERPRRAPRFAAWLTSVQQFRKPLLFAIPLLIVAAYMLTPRPQAPAVPAPAGLLGAPSPNARPSAPAALPALAPPPARNPDAERPPVVTDPLKTASSPVAKPAAKPAAKPSAQPAASKGKATLTFALVPWGDVYVDGKRAGESPPLTRLKLASGKHKIEIRNRGFAPYRRTVTLKEGQSIKIRHKFE
jgi:serine/threonine-protein kinase